MDWQSKILHGSGPIGKPIVSIIAKRTYEIAPNNIFIANEQKPINTTEIVSSESNPYYSETIAESDLVIYKPFTDIVVLGKAHSPIGKKAYYLDCEVQVGTVLKAIRVYGQRKLEYKIMRGFTFTDPMPFDSMEIGYLNAFGGIAKSKDGILYPYPPNHLGKGFNIKSGFEDYSDIVVPCLENPEYPIEPDHLVCDKFDDWKNLPKPVSFGWTKQNFFPRFTYAGIMPELPGAYAAGMEINSKLPKFNFRFFQGASEGLCNQILNGNEQVKITYMDPEYPIFEFNLPNEKPTIQLSIDSEPKTLNSVLCTVQIDMESHEVVLVWRGTYEIDPASTLTQGVHFEFDVQ